VSVGLFVLIVAGTVVISVIIFAVDWLITSCVRASSRASGTRTPPWTLSSHKEFLDHPELQDDDLTSATGVRFSHRPASRTFQTSPAPRGWLSYRLGQSSFHGSVLHGNLVRIIILFHFPVTVFACFQFSQGPARSSIAAVVLAALAFAVFSVALPAWLLFRVATTPTSKLYDETRTLLMLGPLYSHYTHGAQRFAALPLLTNLAYGIAIGCGERSGTAQSIIVLFVEVAAALTTSVYLPWGRGAAMGGVSFTLCVARIVTAVLLVILSPAVSVGAPAAGWIAYAVLFIQALVYLFFFLILVSKLIEAAVRVV
jgi:Transient receptor potential (TRP) ion channel